MPNPLQKKVYAARLSLEGLLKLLGGSEEDRERFWEILTGLTTPREGILVANQLDAITASLKQVGVSAQALQKTAKSIAQTAAKTAVR